MAEIMCNIPEVLMFIAPWNHELNFTALGVDGKSAEIAVEINGNRTVFTSENVDILIEWLLAARKTIE
jgi:hypothetical protein